jgi:hypothetical protein
LIEKLNLKDKTAKPAIFGKSFLQNRFVHDQKAWIAEPLWRWK